MEDVFRDYEECYVPPFRGGEVPPAGGPDAPNLANELIREETMLLGLSVEAIDRLWRALRDPRTTLEQANTLIEILGKQWHFRAESTLFACFLLFPDPMSRWSHVEIGNYYTYSSLIHFKDLCESALLQFYSTHPQRRARALALLEEVDAKLEKPSLHKFELALTRGRRAGTYTMRIQDAQWPGCIGESGTLRFPKADVDDLREFGFERQHRSMMTEDLRHVGAILCQALKNSKLEKHLDNSMILSQREPNCMGMSLVLHFLEDTQELSALPWNALYNEKKSRFLVRDGDMIVVFRIYPKHAMPMNPWRKRRDIRLLVIRSEPPPEIRRRLASEGLGLRQLDTQAEKKTFDKGLKNWNRDSDTILRLDQVRARDEAIFEEISDHRYDYDGVHYFGHGLHHDGKGYLIFEEERGPAGPLRSGQDLLSLIGKNRNAQIATLMACQSAARSDQEEGHLSLAETLTRGGIPSVIAMQQPVRKTTAMTFSRHFYHELMRTQSIDRAFKLALASISYHTNRQDAPEWCAPVLYTRRHGLERRP